MQRAKQVPTIVAALVLSAAGALAAPEGEPPAPLAVAASRAQARKVTYLGVVTGPVSAERGAQLGLPEGVGLVVQQVMPGSPADKAGVQQHDVLHKLRDQVLVNQGQLRTLLRQCKKGDAIELTLIRGDKSMAVKATADEREAGELEAGDHGPIIHVTPDAALEQVQRLLKDLHADGGRRLAGPGVVEFNANVTSAAAYDDGTHKLTLQTKDGKKTLTVKDKDGKVLFDGPIDTPEERQAVPAEVRAKLDKLESSTRLGMQVQIGGPADAADFDRLREQINQQLEQLRHPAAQAGRGVNIDELRQRINQQLEEAKRRHRQLIEQLQRGGVGGAGLIAGGAHASAVATSSDDEHTLTLRVDESGKHLTVKDNQTGKVTFDGPVNSDADRAKVPTEVRPKLKRLDASVKIDVQAGPQRQEQRQFQQQHQRDGQDGGAGPPAKGRAT